MRRSVIVVCSSSRAAPAQVNQRRKLKSLSIRRPRQSRGGCAMPGRGVKPNVSSRIQCSTRAARNTPKQRATASY